MRPHWRQCGTSSWGLSFRISSCWMGSRCGRISCCLPLLEGVRVPRQRPGQTNSARCLASPHPGKVPSRDLRWGEAAHGSGRALINNPCSSWRMSPRENLDSRSSRAVIAAFERAKQSLSATIFMVTHDSFAASFCDRVIMLQDGVIWRVLEREHNPGMPFRTVCWMSSATWEGVSPCRPLPMSTATSARKTGGSTRCWGVRLFLRAADHGLRLHDALSHHSHRSA